MNNWLKIGVIVTWLLGSLLVFWTGISLGPEILGAFGVQIPFSGTIAGTILLGVLSLFYGFLLVIAAIIIIGLILWVYNPDS